MNNVEKARLQFATWIKETNPSLFDQAIEYAEKWRLQKANEQGDPSTLSGLGVTPAGTVETQSFWGKFAEGLTNLATGVLAYKTQKAVLQTNIERADKGLPPIDMAVGAPMLRTQIDVTPEIAARLQQTAMESTQKILLWGGLGLGAFLLLKMMTGGKRR